jgi:hypothetical protein
MLAQRHGDGKVRAALHLVRGDGARSVRAVTGTAGLR